MLIRRRTLLAATGAIVALGGSVAGGATAQSVRRGSESPPAPGTGIQAILRRGDPNATHLRAVLTTTQAAEALIAPGDSSNAPSVPAYLACKEGAKAGSYSGSESPPAGVHPKLQPVLCLVLITSDLEMTFTAALPHYPKLSTLGNVLKLSRN